jgi:hypothetical protein
MQNLAGLSPGGTLAVYAYGVDANTGSNFVGIELVRDTEHFNILEPQAAPVKGFFGGERFFYLLGQVLHAVTIESSAPVDTVVADGDYAPDAGRPRRSPRSRAARSQRGPIRAAWP